MSYCCLSGDSALMGDVLMDCCHKAEDGRFCLGVLVSVAGAAMFLMVLLAYPWEFKLATSPWWQVAVYHVLLGLVLSTNLIVASSPPLCGFQVFRRFLVGLALAVPVVVFAVGWVLTGAYSFRDDRALGLVVVSVSAFMLLWALVNFCLAGFLLGRGLARLGRRGVVGTGNLSVDSMDLLE